MNTRIKLNKYGDIEYCYIWLAIHNSLLKASTIRIGVLLQFSSVQFFSRTTSKRIAMCCHYFRCLEALMTYEERFFFNWAL